jgi:hypothetical protein
MATAGEVGEQARPTLGLQQRVIQWNGTPNNEVAHDVARKGCA